MNKIRTFEIITLGCKVNEYETRYYQEQLEKLGLIEIHRDSEDEFNSNSSNLNHSLNEKNERSESEADVVIINTCTVTNTAAAKSRKRFEKHARKIRKRLSLLWAAMPRWLNRTLQKACRLI